MRLAADARSLRHAPAAGAQLRGNAHARDANSGHGKSGGFCTTTRGPPGQARGRRPAGHPPPPFPTAYCFADRHGRAELPEASATAAPTPTAEPTLRLGFGTEILGRNHILNANQTIEYGFCPPTSGDHYAITGVGPIRNAVYPNNAEQPPGGWVHNLEHGWVVLLYSCKNGCPSADEMAQMQAWYDAAPTPDPSQGCAKEVLVARFDSMTTRFAELAWGRAMLTDQFDLETAKIFTQQWMDAGSEPEKTIC